MSRKTRKLIWSAPLVAVLAVAGVLAMFMALDPGSVFANPLPNAPSTLKVEAAADAAGRTTLVLDWDAPSGGNVSGYRIDMSNRGGVWETLVMDTASTTTTYTDGTLTADDVRWYRVFAVNDHGVGPVSNAVSGTTDKKVNPGSVMNLRAVPNTKNSYMHIDLSWDAPTENGGEKIVGYEVQYHNGSSWGNLRDTTFTANNVTVTTKTKITDMSTGDAELDAGDKRLYRVRAINGPDDAADDNTVAVPDTAAASVSRSKEWVRVEGMTTAATDPGQVTGLTAVNTGTDGNQISLYWYDPEDTGGWPISGYLVQARREGKKFQAIPKNEDLTSALTTVTLGGGTGDVFLDNANRYVARNTAAMVSQAVFIDIAEVDHDGKAGTAVRQVNWYFRVYAVTIDDGPDDDVEVETDNVIRRSRSASNEANDLPADRDIDHDDEPDTGELDPLAAPGIDPTGSSGEAPTERIKQEIRLELTVASALTTAEPDVEQIAYRIDYSKDGIGWKLLEDDTRFTGFGADKPYDDDKGLGFDEQRYYRVFAIGKDPYTDVGPPSAETNGTTPSEGSTAASTAPKKSTGVMASAPSLRSIEASWTAPENNGGQDIVKYYYQYVPDDDDEVAEAEDFDDANNNNFTGAIPGGTTEDAMTMGTLEIKSPTPALAGDTVYVFRVAAVNKDGTADRPATADAVAPADWSEATLFNTTEAAKPNAVEGLTSEAATDTSGTVTGVNLLWNKPSDKIAVTGYNIEVQDDEGDWVNPQGGENSRASLTSYTDSDEPEADEVLKYRVRATNGVGDGPWTMVYYPRDPADDHMHPPATAALTTPTGVTATSDTDGEVTVMWMGGDNADRYFIIALEQGSSPLVIGFARAESGASEATITGLNSDASHLVIVLALKGTGDDRELEYGTDTVTVQ